MSVNNGYNEFICNMILNGNEDDCRSNCKKNFVHLVLTSFLRRFFFVFLSNDHSFLSKKCRIKDKSSNR